MATDDSQRLSLEQTQTQRLLPLQVRVGRLLEMNAIEVEEEVKRALEELPALEVADSKTEAEDAAGVDDGGEPFTESAEEMQLADYRGDDEIPAGIASRRAVADRYDQPSSGPETSLIDYLTRQFDEQGSSPTDALIARYIIGNIDDNGYMGRELSAIVADLAIQDGLDVTIQDVRRVWQEIRELDPPGIAAVDLRDCLLLQLKRRKETQAVADAREIVADYFDLFSKKHFDRIASMMSISRSRFKDALAVIRQLNPKPGSQFGAPGLEENGRHIVPDFAVETDGDTITLTLLNNIPELQIEQTFADAPVIDSSRGQRRDVSTFLRQHRDEAREFIKVLKARQQTLFRVMSAIVKLQRDFFLTDDPGRIRPMILKDVSALTGDDLSVISRATASKYVATQRGVYPIKMFFNERVQEDDDTSSHRIMADLRRIIEAEDKHHPLSDELITKMLRDKGYNLARRTTAKYRERLGIPVARLRKEL